MLPDESIAERQVNEERFLLRLGISKPLVAAMRTRAARNHTTIEMELLASGVVEETAYYDSIAKVLGLRFVDEIDASLLSDSSVLDSQLIRPTILRLHPPEETSLTLVVPQAVEISGWLEHVSGSARLRAAMAVTTPTAVRRAVWKAGETRRANSAADQLFDQRPDLSARSVLTGGQGFLAGFLLMAYLCCLLIYPVATLHVSHMLLSSTFFVLIMLRGLATRRSPKPRPLTVLPDDAALPVYTVLVALYREHEIVDQLAASLLRLDWPHSRLDIKLVCEVGDTETIEALRAKRLPPHFEIVEVPDRQPRTKPKALNYALAGARGDYLVIYDAEDRPHFEQLREAHAHFSATPVEVACLQAPLIIGNAGDSWLSAVFSLEYSGLFRRLLPFLGSRRQPMPLGGTSNHFRIEVLREVGAWDPYNVTEDADLGMRLYRLGYRAETLTRYTVEDAPVDERVWLGQRSRWFKGWMQTWLVLMRRPLLLSRELGLGGTVMFHVLVTGMLVSALGHPFILVFIAMMLWTLTLGPQVSGLQFALLIIDWLNITLAYTIFVRLGWQAMGVNERARVGFKWRWVPVYWMLMSLAAWRAAIELYRNPFFWNKTPHKPSGVSRTGTQATQNKK
jgi:cellulose synthase/poly-beta-1,6-N-acetylglucosamine synthase-like glycosyltransferase